MVNDPRVAAWLLAVEPVDQLPLQQLQEMFASRLQLPSFLLAPAVQATCKNALLVQAVMDTMHHEMHSQGLLQV